MNKNPVRPESRLQTMRSLSDFFLLSIYNSQDSPRYLLTYIRVFLFSFVKKFHADEYDIPLDRIGHCREPHVLSFFFILAFVSELWPQTSGTSIQGERNNWYQLCSNVLQFPIKIYSFEIFTRASPGSSLVCWYDIKFIVLYFLRT